MKRFGLALLVSAVGCDNFDQLERDALGAAIDAGLIDGGAAGGRSGGSAGSMGGGSAGGMSGGSAGGMGGGSSGGMGGGASGGVAPPPEGWSGVRFVSRPTQTYRIAASGNLFVEAFAQGDGRTAVQANSMTSLSLVTTPNAPADLDARFGMATAVLNDRLFVFAGGSWNEAPDAGVSGTFYTAPLYRRDGGADTRIALYAFSQDSGMRVAEHRGQDGGFSSHGSPLAVGSLGQPSYLRVRPDVGGQYGTIVSDSFYARIENTDPMIQTVTRLLVASSETQQSIVAGFESAPTRSALFWLPDGAVSLPSSPTYRVNTRFAGDGGGLTQALATNGSRHAAVIGPAGGADEWTLGSALGSERVAPAEGQWLVLLFGAGTTRFISLGPAAQPPFDLAFGTAGDAGSGLFVMANCRTDAGICAEQGSAIGFLPQP